MNLYRTSLHMLPSCGGRGAFRFLSRGWSRIFCWKMIFLLSIENSRRNSQNDIQHSLRREWSMWNFIDFWIFFSIFRISRASQKLTYQNYWPILTCFFKNFNFSFFFPENFCSEKMIFCVFSIFFYFYLIFWTLKCLSSIYLV